MCVPDIVGINYWQATIDNQLLCENSGIKHYGILHRGHQYATDLSAALYKLAPGKPVVDIWNQSGYDAE